MMTTLEIKNESHFELIFKDTKQEDIYTWDLPNL